VTRDTDPRQLQHSLRSQQQAPLSVHACKAQHTSGEDRGGHNDNDNGPSTHLSLPVIFIQDWRRSELAGGGWLLWIGVRWADVCSEDAGYCDLEGAGLMGRLLV
jgi:hypothetical protein